MYLNIASDLYGKQMNSKLENKLYLWMIFIYVHLNQLGLLESNSNEIGWLVVLRINVDLAIFQPYFDLEAGDNHSLKIQVARPGIEPGSSCSASQELNHSATAAQNSNETTMFKINYAIAVWYLI